MRINHFPAIAVAPENSQTIYAVWNDGRWEPVANLCDNTGRPAISPSAGARTGARTGPPRGSTTMRSATAWTSSIPISPFTPTARWGLSGTTAAPTPTTTSMISITANDRRRPDLERQCAGERFTSNPDEVVDVKGIADVGYRPALVYGPDFAMPGWLDTRLGPREGDLFVDRGTSAPSTTPTRSPTPTPPASATPTATPPAPPATPCGSSSAMSSRQTISTGRSSTWPATAWSAAMATTLSALQPDDPGATEQDGGERLRLAGPDAGHPDLPGRAGQSAVLCLRRDRRGPWSDRRLHLRRRRRTLSRPLLPAHGECDARPALENGRRGERLALYTPPAPTFADVPASSPFFGFVERAYAQSLLSGYSCGGDGEPCPGLYFRPGNNSTRGQLSKILYNALVAP